MQFTTNNIKSLQYNENHEIYLGTHTGTFKKLNLTNDNPYLEEKLQSIEALDLQSKVTCLEWGNDDQTQILIGRANKFVKIFDLETNDAQTNVEMIDGPIVGLCRYDGVLVAGIANGQIQILRDGPDPSIIKTGTHIDRLKQCIFNKKTVATGGKGRQNNLKVWDLSTKAEIFRTKNLPNDSLQLEVPVWDNDFVFFDENTLATCSRYGYIRYYDKRAQRRPVLKYQNPDEQISYSCLSNYERMLYVGTTTTGCRAFDSRNLKHQVHTYKGFTGTVSDIGIDPTGKYMFTSALDRYVRVFSSDSPSLLYQCYVKSKATKILLKKIVVPLDDTIDTDCAIIEQFDDNNTTKPSEDPEFDDLFDAMPKVQEGVEEEEDTKDVKEIPTKKRKLFKRKTTKQKKAKLNQKM